MKKTISLFILFLLVFSFGEAKKIVVPPDSDQLRTKAEYYFLQAITLRNKGELAEAFDLYRYAISLDSSLIGAHFDLSAFFTRINPSEAVSSMEKAANLDPSNYWTNLLLGRYYEQFNQPTKAVDVYKRMKEEYPFKGDIKAALADLYSGMDSLKQAIEVFDELEQIYGANEAISLEKFKLFVRMNQQDSAFSEMQELIKRAPLNVRYRIVMGDLYLDLNRNEEALACYREAEKIEPSNAYLLISLSRYYQKIGENDQAKKLVENALVNNDLDVETKLKILSNYLVQWYEKTGDVEPAYQLFATLLEQHPQEVELYSLYANFLNSQKKTDEAIEQLEVAVALEPTNVELWFGLIGGLMQLEKYESVLLATEQALQYFPQSPEIYFYRGGAYFQLKQMELSLEAYQTGLEYVPQNNPGLLSSFYGIIGDVYYQMEQMDNCFQAYDKALQYNPNNIMVLNNYAYFLSVLNQDLNKAERMSGKTIELEPDNVTYLDTYAWIYFKMGEMKLAKFYIERAIKNGGDKDNTVVEHYGDILFSDGEVEKALEQWKKAEEMGSESKVLKEKIKTKTYIQE